MNSDRDHGLWGASVAERVETRPLDRDRSVDLVVVGGGFTGCAAALEAARLGAKVAVLEANSVGFGGSGRNVGLVNASLWLPPDTIIGNMGATDGQRLIAALAQSPDTVFEIITREGLSCEATRTGTLHLAHSSAGLAGLRERLRQAKAHGMEAKLLDARQVRARTGSGLFYGALSNPQAGTVQPLAYCHGLARAAQKIGAEIYEASAASGICRQSADWVVSANGHKVTGQYLLLAVNGYPVAGAEGHVPACIPVHYSQFATAPLPARKLDRILPDKEGCWDTALVMSSFRLDRTGRLIVGGMGNSEGAFGGLHDSWARRKLAALFPELAGHPFEYRWSGRIAMTSDHIPRMMRHGAGGYSIFGYSGRGIAPGTVFGILAARAVLQDRPDLVPLPVTESHQERLTGTKGMFFEAGAALAHSIDARRKR